MIDDQGHQNARRVFSSLEQADPIYYLDKSSKTVPWKHCAHRAKYQR